MSNNQHEVSQKKVSQKLKSFQDLYIRLSFNRQQPQTLPYPISPDPQHEKSSSSILTIKIDTILKIASSLILKKKVKLNKFMNIFVEIENKLVNVFKLKKGGQLGAGSVKLKREDQCFYLNVWIIDLQRMDKTNPLHELTSQQTKYEKVMGRLEQNYEVFIKEIQNLNDQQKSCYDIAYFFAEPLVEPQKIRDFPHSSPIYENLKLQKYRASGSDVSFQKEYDKFINVIQADNFFANITIEMMVATENNIRQVLSERCNILHFSCHGEVDYLRIEKDRNVGYLDALTSARLIKLLDGRIKPKIIIFNACYSKKIAFDVHEKFPEISTIGYEGEADDNYCEILTERLYEGIYKKREPFFKIFDEVKKEIATKNQAQAKKLFIFQSPTQPKFDHQKTQFPVNQNYNINWAYFQNLGQKEPIGIKKTLYEFVKNYLLNKQKTKFFVVGQPQSGKSIFIKKALYYTMHRCVFRQKLQIDLTKGEKPIVNMLQLKLQYKNQIHTFIKQHKNTNVIIVIDHCNDLIRNQPEEFMKFFKRVEKEMKLGKIILVSDNISYFMEINILIDENVYVHEEVVPAKVPGIRNEYKTYMNRWHPKLEKRFEAFFENRVKNWFEALRMADSQEAFDQNLQRLKQKDVVKQGEKLMVDLQQEFDRFRDKILNAQRRIKAYLTSGYFSRSQQCFIFLDILPQFTKATHPLTPQPPLPPPFLPQRKPQKYTHIQQLTTCYQQHTKPLILHIITALGKFHTQNYPQQWWEDKLLFVTEKLFVIVGVVLLVKEGKQAETEVKEQLFNAYTLVVKLFNRYQKLMSQLPRVMAQCQAIKLKIYMALYSLYKHQYYVKTIKDKTAGSRRQSRANPLYSHNMVSSINNHIDLTFTSFLSTLPTVTDPFARDSLTNNQILDQSSSNNNVDYGFGRESVSQRDSWGCFGREGGRDSLRTQREGSEVKNSNPQNSVNNNQVSNIRGESSLSSKKPSVFKDFEAQLKQHYCQTQYWQLIEKTQQMDTLIRTIHLQQTSRSFPTPLFPPPLPCQPPTPHSLFDPSPSHQTQRLFQHLYHRVQKFYKLHNQITILYERFYSSVAFEDEHSISEAYSKVKKVFFSETELEVTYLYGLKLVGKLFEAIDDQYAFEYEQWYREKLRIVREKLVRTERILEHSIAKKLNKDRDLSYKKIYKEYLELYIERRFDLERMYSSFTANGEKEQLGIFNKLLKLSDDARSIQLKNKIQQYVEKNFYNKCSVLVSQPIGYIPKKKFFSFKEKDNGKKGKNTGKKQAPSLYDTDKERFFSLNTYRASDIILNEMKNAVQKKVLSQIHIETELFNYEKLRNYSQDNAQDSRKKRLIYLIMCDCKKSAHYQTFFVQNELGESIKKYTNDVNMNKFPYAPVIMLFGSNTDLLESHYRHYCESTNRKIAIITLSTSPKIPQVEQHLKPNFKEMFKYVWNDYLQKHLGVQFLASFWVKFIQIYFDEEHESFRNQVVRSFNVAKQESVILLKKRYLEGLNGSQMEKEIDGLVGRLGLYVELGKEGDDQAVNLQNNLKLPNTLSSLQRQPSTSQPSLTPNPPTLNQSRFQQQLLRLPSTSSTTHQPPCLHQSSQPSCSLLSSHQIGSNFQIHEFLRLFFQNLHHFDQNNQEKCHKNFIIHNAHLNDANMLSFAKGVYHKLLRMAGRFEAGVEFRNVERLKAEEYERLRSGEEGDWQSLGGTEGENRLNFLDMNTSQEIKEENSFSDSSNTSEMHTIPKQKRVELYYNIPFKDLKPLLQTWNSHDQPTFTNSLGFLQPSNNSLTPVTFRIMIVQTPSINHDLQYYFQSKHSCHIQQHKPIKSLFQNLYHACDAILHYSKWVEGFSLAKVIDGLYNKKDAQEGLKYATPKQVRDKVVEYFQKKVLVGDGSK